MQYAEACQDLSQRDMIALAPDLSSCKKTILYIINEMFRTGANNGKNYVIITDKQIMALGDRKQAITNRAKTQLVNDRILVNMDEGLDLKRGQHAYAINTERLKELYADLAIRFNTWLLNNDQ